MYTIVSVPFLLKATKRHNIVYHTGQALADLQFSSRNPLLHEGPALAHPPLSVPSAHVEPVALPVLGLELLGSPEALEGSIDHDPHPGAQGLTLGHAVGGQEHRAPVAGDALYDTPQELTGTRINT